MWDIKNIHTATDGDDNMEYIREIGHYAGASAEALEKAMTLDEVAEAVPEEGKPVFWRSMLL